MAQNKKLLLIDLCARFPYGVKAYVKNWSKLDRKYYEDIYDVKSVFPSLNEVHVQSKSGSLDVLLGYYDYDIKPYLFPLSSITEEQRNDVSKILIDTQNKFPPYGAINSNALDNLFICIINQANAFINYCLMHHLDINGLIEKGLAIDATGLNIY